MPNYHYTAIEPATGRMKHGRIDAADPAAASARIRSEGLAPVSLKETVDAAAGGKVKAKGFRPRWRAKAASGIARKRLVVFTRQLATLVNAGMPLMRCLEVLGRQERDPRTVALLADLAATISAGGKFSDGLLRHPRCFESLYVSMVKAGEAGGALGAILERLAQHLEESARLKAKVKAALVYPAIIMLVAAVIVSVLLVFVVPKFELIFSGLLKGQPLPALTRALLGVSAFIRGQVWMAIGAGLLAWLLGRAMRRTPNGAHAWDGALLLVPFLGGLVVKAATARFARTWGSLLASGVPILDALVITRNTTGNVRIGAALDRVHERIRQGEPVARSLDATRVFPAMVAGMIQVGEETGALPAMLERVADAHEDEVDTAVAALTSVIEPVMIVLMALVVGVIVIALFLPIVSVIQHLQ